MRASDAQGAKAYNQCFLFDMVKELPGATPFLKQLLENPKTVKVLHDCRQDAAALLVQKGISLRNVYDTQARMSAILWQGMSMLLSSELQMYACMCPDAMHGDVYTWLHIAIYTNVQNKINPIYMYTWYHCQGKSRYITGLCWSCFLICSHPCEAVKFGMIVLCCDHG